MKKTYMDIHTHILPGIDDGPKSMEETMNMIGQAHEEGVRVMIATPHYGVINHGYSDETAYRTLVNVIKEAKAAYPDMRFAMGNEIYYTPGIAGDLLDAKARPLGDSKYVLVEFSTTVEYETIMRALDEFMFYGFRVIIAHAERYECLQNRIESVRELVEKGAYVQVNCRSITGGSFAFEKSGKWCRKLLKENMVHFVASDCHNDDRRKPEFNEAVKLMIKYIGEEKTEKIINGNIISLIKNESIS